MKKTTDAHRMDASFAVGDWVYVKLCFYCQTFLSSTTYQKLGRVYYGPYQIKETIGSVAYKLAPFDSAKIHLVFHYSLLKPYHGPILSEQPLPWKTNQIGRAHV